MAAIEFPLACSGCGESLTGTDLSGNCPHCGRTVGVSINLVIVDPTTLQVSDDVACVRCGYNVRTLAIDAVCPECAEPVAHSLRPDELRFANPHWLGRVRGGITCLIVALLGLIGVPILGVALSLLAPPQMRGEPVGSLIISAFVLIVVPVGCVGVLLATAADPHPRACSTSAAPRRLARGCMGAAIAGTSVLWLATQAGPSFGNMTWSIVFFAAGFLAVSLLTLVGVTCVGVCLRHLARRARRPGLSRLTTAFIWTVGGSGGLMIAAGVLSGLSVTNLIRRAPAITTPSPGPGAGAAAATSRYPTTAAQVHTVKLTEVPIGTTRPVAPPARPASRPTMAPVGSVGFNGPLMLMMGVANCFVQLAMVTAYVLGLVVLFKSRGMLVTALAGREPGCAVEGPAALG
jgi:Zn finger protein HypA/HybF involved in hydrogenase expression